MNHNPKHLNKIMYLSILNVVLELKIKGFKNEMDIIISYNSFQTITLCNHDVYLSVNTWVSEDLPVFKG